MSKIVIVGMGYVGLSNGILLAQHNEVELIDIDKHKIEKLNNGISPIKDNEMIEYLRIGGLNLRASSDLRKVCSDADFIVIATPTNYDEHTNYFDTSSIESTIKTLIECEFSGVIIVKSTIPIGYIKHLRESFCIEHIYFSPEFLREGRALYDNLYPSRIIIGGKNEQARDFVELLKQGAKKSNIPTLFVGENEAESIKLFANTYLAMRIAYFNELDSFAQSFGLNPREIIEGVCLDDRIGKYYNNPSFGYGGYCLPKDTRQLLANYKRVPNSLIKSIVESNKVRKEFIAHEIKKKNPKIIGIYRLIMKQGSDNFRSSAIFDIVQNLKNDGIEIIVYEPLMNDEVEAYQLCNNLPDFKKKSDLILANRMDKELDDCLYKVYSRDIFNDG